MQFRFLLRAISWSCCSLIPIICGTLGFGDGALPFWVSLRDLSLARFSSWCCWLVLQFAPFIAIALRMPGRSRCHMMTKSIGRIHSPSLLVILLLLLITMLFHKENYAAILGEELYFASAYCNTTERCNLCIEEKIYIQYKQLVESLNKTLGAFSSCRHISKYILASTIIA